MLNETQTTMQNITKSTKQLVVIIPLFLALITAFCYPTTGLALDRVALEAKKVEEQKASDLYYPTYPTPTVTDEKQRALIARGEYLTKMGDCISCHTEPKGKPFAGGLPLHTPFGVFYSPNITPDKATGIGKWSDADFIRAMHEGISPKGAYYFPVFPYTSFTKVSDADILAIKAYLMSIPAVRQENKKPGAPWPFSWRFAQLFWRSMFFEEGYYKNDPKQSAEWNRGAYLVEGLGHCGECHTPRNSLGAMKTKHNLAGAFIDDYWAPNITGAALAKTPHDQIVAVFKESQLINEAGPVRGPMAEVNHNSMVYLAPEDLRAITTYLQGVQSHPLYVPEIKKNQSHLQIGIEVYKKTCAICHDTGKVGAPLLHDTGNWASRLQKRGIKGFYTNVINGYNQMPPMGGCVTCTHDDIEDAVDYIVDVMHSLPNMPLPRWTLSAEADTSVARGKVVYDRTCGVCHNEGLFNAPKLSDTAVWSQLVKKNIDVLIDNTIKGTASMPPKGGCKECTNADVIAAVKYMVQQGVPNSNYSLW